MPWLRRSFALHSHHIVFGVSFKFILSHSLEFSAIKAECHLWNSQIILSISFVHYCICALYMHENYWSYNQLEYFYLYIHFRALHSQTRTAKARVLLCWFIDSIGRMLPFHFQWIAILNTLIVEIHVNPFHWINQFEFQYSFIKQCKTHLPFKQKLQAG